MSDKKNSILIIDDEVLALSYLKDTVEDVIKEIPELSKHEIFGTSNYNDFMHILSENAPSIIFLDVQMPKKTGLEIAKEIRENYKTLGYNNDKLPIIIFTTAHENYGYQAFKVNAYDYILKPIDDEKIKDVLCSAVNDYDIFNEDNQEEYVTVHSSGIDLDIPLKDILYFKADMKYIAVVTENKEFLINQTLLNLEDKYPNFIKLHRAFLVNPRYIIKIKKVDNNLFVSLKNHNIDIPVSRRQKNDLEQKIDYKLLLDE